MSCPPPGCPPNCPPGCPPACDGPGVSWFFNQAQECQVLCKDGLPFSWTVPANTVIGRSLAEANYLAVNLACQRARTGKICFTTISLPDGKVGEAYDQTIRAIGGVPFQFPFTTLTGCATFNAVPYKMEVIDGALPDGLTLGCIQLGSSSTTGQITGTPTLGGLFTFVVRATDAVGAYQRKQFSIRIIGSNFGNITPLITGSTLKYWNSGNSIPAGTYRVNYVSGAYKPDNVGSPWELNNQPFGRGYKITYSGGTVYFPGTNTGFGSQALVEAANAGKSQVITHSGGLIGMYLQDAPYSDNQAGSPNPTFLLSA